MLGGLGPPGRGEHAVTHSAKFLHEVERARGQYRSRAPTSAHSSVSLHQPVSGGACTVLLFLLQYVGLPFGRCCAFISTFRSLLAPEHPVLKKIHCWVWLAAE
jgi:hypothetical protein